MNKELSISQRIHNAAGSQEVENLHARHEYLHAKSHGKEEWGVLWSKSDDCSWAHEFGRVRGFKNVFFISVTDYDTGPYEKYVELYEQYPEVLGGADPRALPEIAFHTIDTDIIEVADDGMSARAFFFTPGIIIGNLPSPSRPMRRAHLCWERYGSDFVFEDGKWLYLHEQVCPDIIAGPLATANDAHEQYSNLINPNYVPRPARGGPKVDDPGPFHFDYSPTQIVQNTVPWPVPYATIDNSNTYTPFIR